MNDEILGSQKKKNEVHEHNAEKGTLFSIPQTRIHTNIIRSLQNDKNLIIIITYLEHTTTKTKKHGAQQH